MYCQHVFLIGMPGSGKSSLGRRVAQRLSLPYIDLDQYIESFEGMSVNEVFRRKGEAEFRKLETEALMSMCGFEPSVVSTGGGTAMRDENVNLMRNMGVIVFVDRPLEQILSDIKLDRRPMLRAGGKDKVVELYNERYPRYKAVADYIFDNGQGFYNGMDHLAELLGKAMQ